MKIFFCIISIIIGTVWLCLSIKLEKRVDFLEVLNNGFLLYGIPIIMIVIGIIELFRG